MLISETEFDKNVNEMTFVEKMIFSVRFKKFIPQRCGLKVFLDIGQATPGHFDERIESAIKNSKNIILLMTPDIFYESKNNVNDWIVKELKIAKESKVEIIPVAHRDFEWPKEYHEELDEVIQDVKMCEWVMESFNYLDAMVDKICEFMKDVKYTLG